MADTKPLLGFFVDQGESQHLSALKGVADFIALGGTDWFTTEPTRGAFNPTFQTAEVSASKSLGITRCSRTLGVYPADSAGVPASPNWPAWFFQLNGGDTQSVLDGHVQRAAAWGKGEGDIIVAVNELCETYQNQGVWGERLRDCNLTRKLGQGWPARLISIAKETDPTALIVWNDNAIEADYDYEQRRLQWTIQNAKAAGAQAVGLQCHRTAAEVLGGHLRVDKASQQIIASGLVPVVTEMAIKGGASAEQATAYATLTRQALAGGCRSICCWKVAQGWNGETPLFDASYKPMPALAAVQAEIAKFTPVTPPPTPAPFAWPDTVTLTTAGLSATYRKQ